MHSTSKNESRIDYRFPLRISFAVMMGLVCILGGLELFYELKKFNYNLKSIRFPPFYILLSSVLLCFMALCLRAKNWGYLLQSIQSISMYRLFRTLSLGYLVSLIIPFKLGEVFRAIFLAKEERLSRTVVLISVIIERAVDCFIVGSLSAIISFLLYIKGARLSSTFVNTSIIFVIIGAAVLAIVAYLGSEPPSFLLTVHKTTRIFNKSLRDKLRFISWCTLYGVRLLCDRLFTAKYFVLSILSWTCILMSTGLVATSLIGAERFLELIPGTFLGLAVPSSQGQFAIFQMDFINFRVGQGSQIESSIALFSYIFVSWCLLFIPVAIYGVVSLKVHPINIRELVSGDATTQKLNKLMRIKDISLEFSEFMEQYFQSIPLTKVISRFETHGDEKIIRTLNGGSNACTMILASQDGNLFVRKTTLKENRKKLKNQWLWLYERQCFSRFPQLIREIEDSISYSYDQVYLDDYVPFFDVIHSQPIENSERILKRLLEFMDSKIYQPKNIKKSREVVISYIATKVVEKIRMLAQIRPDLSQLIHSETVWVNSISYPNLLVSAAHIAANEEIVNMLSTVTECVIHGDLTVDNVMIKGENFIILDPNDENAISDPVVDFGKLYQSFHSGYEFLCKNNTSEYDSGQILFSETSSSRYLTLFRWLDERFKVELDINRYKSIYFHEAVHFCRLLPYKLAKNPENFFLFYGTAVRLMANFVKMAETRDI